MAPACRLCGGTVQKRDSNLCLPFCLRESCPSALALMPDTSLSPSCPWWSEAATLGLELRGMTLSKFMCAFFMENCLGLQKFLPLTQSPLVYAAGSYGDFPALEPWDGGACCGAGTPRSRDIFVKFLSTTHGCFWVSTPPTSLDGCGFFNSVAVRLE